MDYYNNYNQPNTERPNMGTQPPTFHNQGQTMAAVSMFMGLACLFTLFTVYLPLIFGSLSILFALLSKGYGRKMVVTAKIGIISAAASLVLIVSIIGALVAFLLNTNGENLISFGQQMDQQFEQQTGSSWEDVFGESYEDMMRDYAEILGH